MCSHCTHKLEASWTGVPATLARNKRLFNIVSQNKELLEKLSTMAQRDIDNVVRTWQRDPELMMQVLQTLTGKPLLTADKNADLLNKFKDNIGQAYRFGLDSAPGSPQLIPRMIEESVKDNVFKFVTRLDDDTRKELGNKLSDILDHNRTAPFEEKLMPRDVAQELSKTLDGNVARAEAIARTETMRAANLASWSQAKAMGATHYTVDSSFEACEECGDVYDGEVFLVDDIDNLPPLHPNCACVPAFGTEEEAQEMADELSQRNEDEVSDLADLGMEPASDGSGPVEITEDIGVPESGNGYEEINQDSQDLLYVKDFGDNGQFIEKNFDITTYSNGTDEIKISEIPGQEIGISHEDALNYYNDLPDPIKENIDEIKMVESFGDATGYTSKDDPNVLYLTQNALDERTSVDYVMEHEGGHILLNHDSEFADIWPSGDWAEAAVKDVADGNVHGTTKMLGEETSFVSEYSLQERTFKEDIPESVALYLQDEQSFRMDYPNRADILDKFLK